MEGIQVTLRQKECLDQQQGKEEQRSVQFFQTTEVQVSQESPANFPDVGKQFHDNRHQPSDQEKLNTKRAKGRNSESEGRVQFAVLLNDIIPQVDNKRATQLQKLFSKLRKNEITRENFLRLVKDIVGNEMLTEVVEKVRNQISSAKTSVCPGTEAKLPPKRRCIQEKPIEEFVTPLILSSKRQKSSATVSDQSVEQLNDVTAVSGINLREEEQKLFSRPQEVRQMSKSSKRVEQEGTLVLQKIPLQGKLAKITSKCGINSISTDVELCLSLSVEERMRGLISNVIRISRQRVDFEKRRHKTLFTSDVQRQIEVMNQIVEEEWEKQRAKESEGGNQVGSDLEKDANCSETSKVYLTRHPSETSKANKVKRTVDDILHTADVNVAAWAAVEGDDWTSKWKLMAKKELKHKLGAMFNSQLSDQMTACLQKLPQKIWDGHELQEKGTKNTSQGDQFVMSQKCAHPISAKDIMAVLEREPQMSKSTFGYCLYERLIANAAAV